LKIWVFLTQCLVRGHDWHVSRSRKGHVTCRRCRLQKKIP
jgi:hypothetical protein